MKKLLIPILLLFSSCYKDCADCEVRSTYKMDGRDTSRRTKIVNYCNKDNYTHVEKTGSVINGYYWTNIDSIFCPDN